MVVQAYCKPHIALGILDLWVLDDGRAILPLRESGVSAEMMAGARLPLGWGISSALGLAVLGDGQRVEVQIVRPEDWTTDHRQAQIWQLDATDADLRWEVRLCECLAEQAAIRIADRRKEIEADEAEIAGWEARIAAARERLDYVARARAELVGVSAGGEG
jgi:hypothetical protein